MFNGTKLCPIVIPAIFAYSTEILRKSVDIWLDIFGFEFALDVASGFLLFDYNNFTIVVICKVLSRGGKV